MPVDRPFYKRRTRNWFSINNNMIISFSVILKELFFLGRNYPWPRPDQCPRCNSSRTWGHGFVSACFDGYDQPFSLKRYRCPDCGCVMRMRPSGYFKGFQAPIKTIRASIFQKVHMGQWLPGILRTRQYHWFNSLCKRMAAYLTHTWESGTMSAFDYLMKCGQIPVSRSI